MIITIEEKSTDPIYVQIINQIKDMIIDGSLIEGEKSPSMRNLARTLNISFVTIKKSYEELNRMGIIEIYTGKGSFIKEHSREYIREEVTGEIMNILADASIKAKKYGMTDKQLHEILQKQFYPK